MQAASLTGRRALVTGAGRGIGRALAIAMAEQGASVVLVARTESDLASVAAVIRGKGGTALPIVADVGDDAQVERLVERTRADIGGVDVLVNNAGGNHLGPIDRMSVEDWWTQVTVHVKAAYLLCRAFVPGMAEAGWGRVINVSSRLGKVGAPMATSYATAKHALIGLTRSLALEFAEKGVTVNAICPGHVDTDLMTEIIEQRAKIWSVSPAEARARITKTNPQQRLVTVDEIVPAVLFLLSDGAARITGESLNISGGAVMH